MCFVIQRKNRAAKIADSDIICFKLLRSTRRNGKVTLKPYFYHSGTYQFGKLNPHVKIKPNWYDNWINEGYHSYSDGSKMMSFGSTYVMVQCIIPKGTRYYYNSTTNEYVSETIKIVKEITPVNCEKYYGSEWKKYHTANSKYTSIKQYMDNYKSKHG